MRFEGEDGSGPGVNRGFFTAFANALKSAEKVNYYCLSDTTFICIVPNIIPTLWFCILITATTVVCM